MKKIAIFFIIIIVIICSFSYVYLKYIANYKLAQRENAKYEIQDNNDLVNGSVIKIRVIAENLTETTYNFNIIKETTTVPKKKNNFFTILLIFLILGIIGVVVFKFIRNILPAKADEKYDYE